MSDLQDRFFLSGFIFLFLLSGFSFAVPAVTINTPENTTYHNASVILNTTITDASLDACAYSLDDWVTNTTFDCMSAIMTVNDGSSTVRVRANDTLGAINDSESVSFTVTPAITDYSIPSTSVGVQDPYQYSPSVSTRDYSIPSTGVWVQDPYVYTPPLVGKDYSIPSTSLWVQEPYTYTSSVGADDYTIPSASLWVQEPYVFIESFTVLNYTIPSVGLNLIIHEETACVSGEDCAGVGGLCINATCRPLTAVEYGVKCSIDSTNYDSSPYVWHQAGCTDPIQSQAVQFSGIMNVTFDFPGLKAGSHTFRAYFEGASENMSYVTYDITPNISDSTDKFANVRLITTAVLSGEPRIIRGEVVE